jgi:hypothetical protein
MSLMPGERDALAQIEQQLRRSDPELAVLLETAPGRPVAPRGRAAHLALTILAALATGLLALGMASGALSIPYADYFMREGG